MTYVDTATAQWTEVEPGYRRMTLVNDRESGTRIVLFQALLTDPWVIRGS